ncbi:hypothetical protein H0H92_015666, partial [Tricholoma furcatifolium]
MIAAQLRGADGYLDGSIERPEQPDGGAKPVVTTATEWWDPKPSIQEWRARNA